MSITSVRALRMMIGNEGAAWLISRHTSCPGVPGKLKSSTSTDGAAVRNISRPAAPFPAISTAKPSPSNNRFRAFWTARSSSITRIRSELADTASIIADVAIGADMFLFTNAPAP